MVVDPALIVGIIYIVYLDRMLLFKYVFRDDDSAGVRQEPVKFRVRRAGWWINNISRPTLLISYIMLYVVFLCKLRQICLEVGDKAYLYLCYSLYKSTPSIQ